MSKRKGLSVEEKRTRMLQIFHEKKDFFQLKELEKIAPKEKGIIVQSVKEIVQSLVDDNLVDTDKIGTSIYFWSYPSKAMNTKKRKLEDIEGQVEENTKKLRNLNEKILESKVGKDESEERTKTLEELTELKAKEEELTKELQMYKDQDPEVYEKMKEDIKKIKVAANVWTDNIFAIRAWCKKKFFIDESTLDKQFSIPADLDYLE